ncbi:hypothetical protein PoB_002853300 [Plakobranchus ocellatus]|uniref:Uncharacterized protein n=1 Tax=Plakobranchus ocellatus TaxID=259542 RepID=A0AAV4A5M8_9GAST|nr:hypothetical protein PoB_002853300 [Plakobranchus ocellatus]
MTSRLGSVGQRCHPISGEGNGQGCMFMRDSHYCRTVTTSTSRIYPSPHAGRISRQPRRPHCGGASLNYFQHLRATVDSTWEENEVEDSRRPSRRYDSAGKEVGIEDKEREKEMSPCTDERQFIGDNLPCSPLTTRCSHGGVHAFPGPHTKIGINNCKCVCMVYIEALIHRGLPEKPRGSK